jgi:hypothetical protein
MVKVGFICEGECERVMVESAAFNGLLQQYNLKLVLAIDARGGGNLLPEHISNYIAILEDKGAEKIIILTDLEYNDSIAAVKTRINARAEDILIIAVRQFEAWILADTATMRELLQDTTFYFEYPEEETIPYETIRQLMLTHTSRGVNKLRLCKRALLNGFTVENAAAHDNCYSAKYFLDQLVALS